MPGASACSTTPSNTGSPVRFWKSAMSTETGAFSTTTGGVTYHQASAPASAVATTLAATAGQRFFGTSTGRSVPSSFNAFSAAMRAGVSA